jgi:hypothetical protein
VRCARTLAALAAALLVPAAAAPFVELGPVWPNEEGPLHVGSLDGSAFRTALVDAARDWEDVSDFDFAVDFAGDGACDRDFFGTGPLDDGAEFETRDCDGFALGSDTLAVTQSLSEGGRFVGAGIVFNEDLDWGIYDGPWNENEPDFRRVALHELGHWLGLGHENGAVSIMASFAGDVASLQPDDVAGARFLYGPTGPPPPPPPPVKDPEVVCRQRQLRAAGELCKKHLRCEAKRAAKPAADPDGLERNACVEAAAERFASRFDTATLGNASCLYAGPAAAALALVAEPAAALEAGLLAGADPTSAADAALRKKLLKTGARACADAFAAEVRFAKSEDEARRANQRAAARTRFVGNATDAVARAAEDGVPYGGTAPPDAADQLDALVDGYAAAAAGE